MPTLEDFVKIPLLLAVLWAHRVSYSPPNPFASAPEAKSKESGLATCVRIVRPEWARRASRWTVRAVALCEILVILAAHVPIFASPYVLAVLDQHDPAGEGAKHLRITPTFALGWFLIISAALLRIACYRTMGKHFTFQITIHKDHRLVTSGPYSVVRHPGYSALLMIVLGTMLCSFGSGSWLRECGIMETSVGKVFGVAWVADLLYVPVVMVFFRLKTEDELLKKEFGREWEEWAKRTPYWLIPGIL
ncbi:hypothetical protein OH77DRAFT_1594147 [Trametes cingulata]|nr:hypothetical protein OH77DRAFT_1594147 [Trametes cingulata]